MRICIDISQSVYEGTGSGRYVLELIRSLLALDTRNDYVLFGSAMRRRDDLNDIFQRLSTISKGNISLKSYPFPPKFFELIWNSAHVFPVEWFAGDIDIYHSSDWVEAPSKAKRVTTVHDLIPFLYPEYVHHRIRLAHERRWKYIQSEVDRIIVDAEVTKQDILRRFKIKDSAIEVIPLACDSRFFAVGEKSLAGEIAEDDNSKRVLEKYGLGSHMYILAVGTLEPRKNIQCLIEAYNSLDTFYKSKYPLVVVGKKAWSENFPHAENVVFTGYVEDADLPYLYSNAKCFVMPSLYEGFGLPVLEAMASGVPVICSNSSSLPEIGGDEVHYIESPENIESIRLVLAHLLSSEEEELLKLAKSAYTRAKTFSWEKTAKETHRVYADLYNGK